MPIEIPQSRPANHTWNFPMLPRLELGGGNKPGVRERVFFTEQLALLLETGTPLHASLQALQKQTTNPRMVAVIDGLLERVNEGKSFSAALGQYPELFPSTYVNLVEAAEEGGFMDRILHELVRMDDKRTQLRHTVTSALSYPVFLTLFSLGVVIFVLTVVFPKFAVLFARIHDQLPGTTLFLMGVSELLTQHWLPLSAGFAAGLAALGWWLHTPAGGLALDNLKMRLVFVRTIFLQIYLTQSLRVLGLSLANGVSVMDALASCRDVVPNRVFRQFITQVEDKVKEGAGFAAAFQEADFIPPTVRQMVTTGEESGSLAHVLGRIADYYERELGKRLATFSRVVEPVMLLVMGVVVGLIVSSLILPIFKLSRAVG
jgi:type II secretory pathway component PulF